MNISRKMDILALTSFDSALDFHQAMLNLFNSLCDLHTRFYLHYILLTFRYIAPIPYIAFLPIIFSEVWVTKDGTRERKILIKKRPLSNAIKLQLTKENVDNTNQMEGGIITHWGGVCFY